MYSESSEYVSQIEKLHYSEKFCKNKILNFGRNVFIHSYYLKKINSRQVSRWDIFLLALCLIFFLGISQLMLDMIAPSYNSSTLKAKVT